MDYLDYIDATWHTIKPWVSWETLTVFANSSFATSCIGAIAGASGGAYAAQRIAKKGKLRDELSEELRSVNTTIALAVGILNSLVALKKQFINELSSTYNADRIRYKDYITKT